ncbi:toll-like receptor 7 [Anoplophora glabripennis]|uniref:toll-like receptor 7 n=1 Tax=Anoplophora glabripennis TaxID=217634 RepID=UPI0008759BED|nr:toll-like receptor 7 [Anoplophora glabripennis]XP_018568504.1 toll-like receptor 7 [Anoplophora glabripennis]
MRTLIIMALFGVLEALHCDKEFNYYDSYGNGFEVICQGLTKEYIHLLENITITNEISLTIGNATLTNVSANIFDNVHNIRYLHLENSTFTFSRMEPVFNYLRRLEHLIIINTQFYINKYTFIGLSRLKELILDNNKLEEVEEGSFQNLPSVNYLQITNNRISDMKNLPLCELRDLRGLNLSRNIISDLREVHFYCRKSEKTVDFNLNNADYILDVKKRDYFSVSDNSFKLTVLDLSHNNISRIEFALADLSNLKVLNLEGNRLVGIKQKELNSLHNIEKIHLNDNALSDIEDKVFSNKKNLKYLDLCSNKLNYFSLNNTPMLEYLNLANNLLDAGSLYNINNTKSLKELVLANNKIGNIHLHTFKKISALEVLNLESNNVILIDYLFECLINLTHLSLRNNSIERLPPLLFKNLTHLKDLDLSSNRIKYFTSNYTFKGLGNLETLNISYNLLQELNYAVLEPLKKLSVLDIAGNQLHYIQYDLIISDLPLLTVLNIKENILSCDILYKIIKFLRHKDITYTINEQFDYEQENVEGIYCSTEKSVVSEGLRNKGLSGESYALLVLGVAVSVVLGVIVIIVALFKIHLFLRRRNYRVDEFELIDE